MNRSVWTEDGENSEDGVVRCTECGKDIEEPCEHLLLAADVTFGICEGGAAYQYWEGYYKQVQDVFAKCLQEVRPPRWKHSEVQEVWDEMHKDIIDVPKEPRLPDAAFISLMIEVLCWSGGTDYGEAMTLNGGRCASVLSLMFASDPEDTCKTAVKTLSEWLVPEKPRVRKRRK